MQNTAHVFIHAFSLPVNHRLILVGFIFEVFVKSAVADLGTLANIIDVSLCGSRISQDKTD